ncbi:hypothetical protein [Candidatus Alkanophaga liquidiphilum]
MRSGARGAEDVPTCGEGGCNVRQCAYIVGTTVLIPPSACYYNCRRA